MKKKIINGFLMVALLAATVTSFVSCKDNDEDVKTDLIAQLQKQAVDLKAAWQQDDAALNTAITAAYTTADAAVKQAAKDYTDAREQAVKDWVAGEGYLKKTDFNDSLTNNDNFKAVVEKLNTAADDIATLQGDMEAAQGDIETLQNVVNDPKKGIEAINNNLDKINDEIKSIIETLENLVTSVTVNATANSIISNSKLFPGIDMQFVGAAYGEPDVKKGTFPTDFVDENLVKISEGKAYKWTEDDFINSNEKEFNAGKIYFTLNPSNITPSKVKLALVNSKQTELFKIGTATETKDELNWGLTRGAKDVTYDAVVYEAPVTYDATTLKALELKEIVDIKAIAKNVKNIINDAKGAAKDINRSNYEDVTKATGKAVLKEAAQAVANLVNVKLPYMPAVALKATWSDTVGTRSVLSDYTIAATAYKPMSFKEFDGVDFSGYSISFDKVDNAVKKVADKIKNELNSIKADLSKCNITINLTAPTGNNKTITVWMHYNTGVGGAITDILFDSNATATGYAVDKKVIGETVNIDATIADVFTEVNKIDGQMKNINDMIQKMVTTINRANSAIDRATTLEKRVTNYLEYMIQRVLNNANRALEPILLVDTNNGINRVSGTYEAKTYTFVPTTVTYELVAPAFQKYIGVIGADGKARWGKVMAKGDKGFKAIDVDLKAGDTQIVYSALDFKGNTITKVYNITVE